jgi:heme-degrading monooxygenase HmoA
MIAKTPEPPYYAVIFSSERTTIADEEYAEMAEKMEALAKQQDGFLGLESARNVLGVTISYWRDLDSIRNWKRHADHVFAQRMGRERWYKTYKTRIALVERDYGFEKKQH